MILNRFPKKNLKFWRVNFFSFAFFYFFIGQLNLTLADWRNPTVVSPSSLTPLPITVSRLIQRKAGSLDVVAGFESGAIEQGASHAIFTGNVGIGGDFSGSTMSADINGITLSDCFRIGSGCLDFSQSATAGVGPTGAAGLNGLQGAPGPVGPTGSQGRPGIQGIAGLPGVDDVISYIQTVSSGMGIILRDKNGNIVNMIGIGTGITDATVGRNFTVNPCTNDPSGLVTSIDSNGFSTCARTSGQNGSSSGVTGLYSSDAPNSSIVIKPPLNNSWPIYIDDDLVIQRLVKTVCGSGQAIGAIRSTGQIVCTPAGGYCEFGGPTGRTFSCVSADGLTKTSINIPLTASINLPQIPTPTPTPTPTTSSIPVPTIQNSKVNSVYEPLSNIYYLQFNFVTVDNVNGYNLYRGNNSNFIASTANRLGIFPVVPSSIIQPVTYTDGNTPPGLPLGVTYCYRISAYRTVSGQTVESTPSPAACATVK